MELRGSKDEMVQILNCTEMENCIHFWSERCQKYALFRKKFKIKVFRHRISDEKVHEDICLPSPGVEVGPQKLIWLEKVNVFFRFDTI